MARIGAQDPSYTNCGPPMDSLGPAAVKLYSGTGQDLMPWQEIQLTAILDRTPEGLWRWMKYGLSLSRRNGKGEVLAARELFGLTRGEKILHTAHRTTTSHDAFLRLFALLKKLGYEEITRKKKGMESEKAFFASKQYGLEHIDVYPHGGIIDFRTRTNNGGLGEGFDLLIVDEAQEYTSKHESALTYTVTASPNPQTILTGTPPTATSGGDVFGRLRGTVMDGTSEDVGWSEWAIPDQTSDIKDVDAWYAYNPSLGLRLSERNVRAELSVGEVDFNIQRLGLWLSYSQKSAISRSEWEALRIEGKPSLVGGYYIGVKFGRDGVNVTAAIAARMDDGRVFVECLACKPARYGAAWVMDYARNPKVGGVVIDGANGSDLLASQLTADGIRPVIIPKVGEIIAAHVVFEQALTAQNLAHSGQPSLTAAASNVEKRAIGSNGGFGYKSLSAEHDVALLDCVVLAHWLCVTKPEEEPQTINY